MKQANASRGAGNCSPPAATRGGAVSSATIGAKAHRYLAEGRLTVQALAGRRVRATCSGGADYTLGHDSERGWYCNCPARTKCAHLQALQLVVIPTAKGRGW